MTGRAWIWFCMSLWCSHLIAQNLPPSCQFPREDTLASVPHLWTWRSKPQSSAVSCRKEIRAADTSFSSSAVLPQVNLEQALQPQFLEVVSDDGDEQHGVEFAQNAAAGGSSFKSTFRRENVIKMTRYFVPGTPLTDAPFYVPMTPSQKFDLFLRQNYKPDVFLSAATDALISQASGAYWGYGGGVRGYGKRYAAALLSTESGSFFGQFLFPTLLHQDPRYFPSQEKRVSDRLAYAVSRVIIGRSDDGRNVINLSLFMTILAQTSLTNAYLPYRNETAAGTIENSLAGLESAAESNILNEFWPSIKKLLVRHEPKSISGWGAFRSRPSKVARQGSDPGQDSDIAAAFGDPRDVSPSRVDPGALSAH